jgi:hypothetical protein
MSIVHTAAQTVQEHATASLTAVSATSVTASFLLKTLPYVQYGAAVLGGVSAVFAIFVAIKKLRE